MKLSLIPFKLENKTPFKIAHGVRLFTDTLFVGLEKEGFYGIGEASHVPYYGISIDESIELIESKLAIIKSIWGAMHEEFWIALNKEFGDNHFAKCAVDIAYYDWRSQKAKVPLWEYLNLRSNDLPGSCYTIGMKDFKTMSEEIKESNFPSFKIKLGGKEDINTIKSVLKLTNKPIKADANGGWDLSEAEKNLKALDNLGLEFIEQPLGRYNLEPNLRLKEQFQTPLFADESCFSLEDVETCSVFFDGINIKLSKCGGIYPALKMVEKARSLNLKVMLGCMTESSIGISTIAHLSSLFDYIDMDGATLLKNDPACGVVLEKGFPIFNDKFGHGAFLKK
jgi:L-Ala-D/L-Glu epimerase